MEKLKPYSPWHTSMPMYKDQFMTENSGGFKQNELMHGD